ncbi:GNAT family N-acetyltransferase [Tersicoccus solisilvae]|nr:GNAT family N-acetyltransferase [Tersicoccus solisilvae]
MRRESTERIGLRALRLEDASVMAEVLADPSLYAFTGGEPPTVEQLHDRYAAQLRGGPVGGGERWVNLIVLLGAQPVGYVQATVPDDGGPATIAWVIGRPWQERGLASRAASLLLAELADLGVTRVIAHIDPAHEASRRVAARLGLEPTSVAVDGETRWVGSTGAP